MYFEDNPELSSLGVLPENLGMTRGMWLGKRLFEILAQKKER
jgi:hypothetical protein